MVRPAGRSEEARNLHLLMPAMDWHEIVHDIPTVAWRTIVLFFVVLTVMRLSGKRTVTAMAPFDLALVIMISEVASIPISETKVDIFNGLVPVVILGGLHMLLTTLNLRSVALEKATEGAPRLLVKKGKVLEDNLKRERVSLADLYAALRLQQVSNLAQVDEAWLEPTGGVSVLLTKQEQPMNDAAFSGQSLGQIDRIVEGHVERLRVELREWLRTQAKGNGMELAEEIWAPPPAGVSATPAKGGGVGQATSPLQLPAEAGGLSNDEAGVAKSKSGQSGGSQQQGGGSQGGIGGQG